MSRVAFAVGALVSALAPVGTLLGDASIEPPPIATDRFPGWPAEVGGRPLEPMALTPAERGFVRGFPGRVGRFSSGADHVILRWVEAPTRMLHPARHCFRATGYDVGPPRLCDLDGETVACFDATRGADRLEVFERIHDDAGQSWTDVSAWHWAASTGASRGPWWSVTRVRRR